MDDRNLIQVVCPDDCARCHKYTGSHYFDDEQECTVPEYKFDAFQVVPCRSERENKNDEYFICPFYVSYEEVEDLFWSRHPYERLELDEDAKTDAICRKVGEACSAIDRMIANVENQLKQH